MRAHTLLLVEDNAQDEKLARRAQDERDRVASYRDGANSYVRKPVEFDRFSDTLIHLGKYWLQTNKPPPEMANA